MKFYMIGEHMARLRTLPVCECGYVFKNISYNQKTKIFNPDVCPNCRRIIESISVQGVDVISTTEEIEFDDIFDR